MNLGCKVFISLLLSITLVIGCSLEASGVTYPVEVENAGRSHSYVAQIWVSRDANESSEFLCSGTLIKADIILTAAHCARELSKGSIDRRWISVGSNGYSPEDSIFWNNVDSVWWNPRFSSETLANDVGLIKLSYPVSSEVASPLALSLPSIYTATKSTTSFSIYGWGVDQNGDNPSILQKANLSLQEKAAKKFYRTQFNPVTMIAAGGWNSNERTYSGGCHGDSGGPLVGNYKGKTILLGVTSYVSSKGCDTGSPTVFARVSYFLNDLTAGEKRLRAQSNFVNSYNVVSKTLTLLNSARNGWDWVDYSEEYTAPNSLGSIRTVDNECQMLVYVSEADLRSDFEFTGITDEVFAEYESIVSLSRFWFLLRSATSEEPCFLDTKEVINWN